MAHNARQDDEVYHRKSIVEATFFALRHWFGETLRASTWFGQFREPVLKAAVRGIELAVSTSTPWIHPSKHGPKGVLLDLRYGR